MDLKELLHAVAKEEQDAIKELYDKYSVAFYYTALAFLNDENKSVAVATEAFRRIIKNAYRFDEALNAQYWLFDVLSTISVNSIITKEMDTENDGVEQDYIGDAAECICAFTELGINEIASILRVRKSVVSSCLKETSKEEFENKFLERFCPDYFEKVISDEATGYEEFSEKERLLTVKEAKRQKNSKFNKRLVSVLLIISFFAIIVILLVYQFGNFGSDIEQNLLGEDILVQFNNKMPCTQVGKFVYFCGEDNKLYRRDIFGNKNERISEDFPKEITSDGQYVYYRNFEDGCMYRIDTTGKNKMKLCDVLGTTMTLYGDRLYFSADRGIYSIPSSGGKFEEAELILDTSTDANLFCVDMATDSEGNVFFASGIGKGIHQITEYDSKPSVSGIFTDEVYNICIDDDVLYFDCKDTTGKILLYRFDIKANLNNESDKRVLPTVVSNSKGENIELSTGAFYVCDGIVYFAGKNNQKNVLYKLDENNNMTEVTQIPSNNGNLEITDIFVSSEAVYCYCSDGKEKGERIFFFRNIENGENITIF